MLKIENFTKSYDGRAGILLVLTAVSLSIERGEICALTGASGSGKTTLMNLIVLLDRPDHGAIHIDGVRTVGLSCLVAERRWDGARWAIKAQAWRFEGVRRHAARRAR